MKLNFEKIAQILSWIVELLRLLNPFPKDPQNKHKS